MTSRIEAALEAIGLSNEYLEAFKAKNINDGSAAVFFKFPAMLKNLEAVIPNPEHLQLFKEAFLNPKEVPVVKIDTKKETETTEEKENNEVDEINKHEKETKGNNNADFEKVSEGESVKTSKPNSSNEEANGEKATVTENEIENKIVEKTENEIENERETINKIAEFNANDSDEEPESKTINNGGSDKDSETESDKTSEIDIDEEAKVENATVTESENEHEIQKESESEHETEKEIESDRDTENEIENERETENEIESDRDTEKEIENEHEIEKETENKIAEFNVNENDKDTTKENINITGLDLPEIDELPQPETVITTDVNDNKLNIEGPANHLSTGVPTNDENSTENMTQDSETVTEKNTIPTHPLESIHEKEPSNSETTETEAETVPVKDSSATNLNHTKSASHNLMKSKKWGVSSFTSSRFLSKLLKRQSIDISPPTGPVQIIDISPNKAKETDISPVDRLIFKGEQLKEILSKVGSRPVALLSIAGPSRQGKSFILGYMLKYLRSLSQSQSTSSSHSNSVSDWMGGKAETKKAPLEDGFKWRFGTKRETVGIWMWPEPFTLKSADGKEFDVLLVDTQGVFDAHTDKKDWATIVGLSLLTSSCLILNIMQHLQEDSLNTLKDFMDFGLMAKDSADQGKPFQKLVFLIRDWGLEDEFPFGFKGGKEYLQQNLGENNTEAGRQIRSQIKECFQQLDCFLMPDPGKKVKKKDYDGSVADMDEEFAQNVQDFIENLFDPSTFPAKVISGEMVTGDDLYTHFEQYLKIFNSSTMPSPEDMNQATILICNQSVVNKCFKHYEDTMQENLEEIQRDFVLEKELLESNFVAQEEATKLFGTSRKMGTSEEIEKSEVLLAKKIGDCFKAAVAEDAIQRNEIIQKEVQNLQEFLINLEELIEQYYSGPDNFILEPQFDAYYDECYLLATKQLAAVLQLESLSLLDKEETLGFENSIKLWRATLEKINQNRKTTAQSSLLERQEALLDNYVSGMKESLQEYQYWTSEDFQRLHTYYSKESLESFSQEYTGSVLFQDSHQKLIQSFEKECQNLAEKVVLQNEKFLMDCSQCVTNLVKVYTDNMEANLNAHNLRAIDVPQEDSCEYELIAIESLDFDRLPREKYENFVKDLYNRTLSVHGELLEKHYPLIRKALLQKYKDALNNFYGNGDTIFKKDILQKKHSSEKKAVLSEFEGLLGEIATAGRNAGQSSDEAVTDFIDEIEAHLKIIEERNALRIEAVKNTVSGYLAQAKSTYINLSHEINKSAYNSSDFQAHSNAAKKEVHEFFKAECRAKANVEPPEVLIEELETFIKELPEFQLRGSSNIIEIAGRSLKCSRELITLEKIERMLTGSVIEVRWIATEKITLDENLCGDLWAGKNLVLYTPQLNIAGNERIINVSGRNEKSAPSSKPPSRSNAPGASGENGSDGEPGERGGNVALIAGVIHNADSLKIISNGGAGGDGQPGGNGSKGKDGIHGDDRFKWDFKDIKKKFPSPAKFAIAGRTASLKQGKKSMEELHSESQTKLKTLEAVNVNCRAWELETKEGARLRYVFFEGALKGTLGMRSFYLWCVGAPGTNGQLGGLGGYGGRGGCGGKPGKVYIPNSFNPVVHTVEGISGKAGEHGEPGSSGQDGVQGTDYALVDPFAGFLAPMANRYEIHEVCGNLQMHIGLKGRDGKSIPAKQAAYCACRGGYVSFYNSTVPRKSLAIYNEPTKPQDQKPPKPSADSNPIDVDALKTEYEIEMES